MENKSLRNIVYDAILSDIFNGTIDSDTILREQELVERFQVSKSPVRDALIELCNEEILVSIPRFGYRLVRYTKKYYDDLLFFRETLEPVYLERNWDKITPADIETLEQLAGQCPTPEESASPTAGPNAYWEYNSNFHLGIARALHDDFYFSVLETTMRKQRVAFNQFYWTQWSQETSNSYCKIHFEIIQAIKQNKKEDAVSLLRNDISTFIQY